MVRVYAKFRLGAVAFLFLSVYTTSEVLAKPSLSNVQINGVALMMFADQVIALKGPPPRRTLLDEKAGLESWEYPGSNDKGPRALFGVDLQRSKTGQLQVVAIGGTEVTLGRNTICRSGENRGLVLLRAKQLGDLQLTDRPRTYHGVETWGWSYSISLPQGLLRLHFLEEKFTTASLRINGFQEPKNP